MARPRPLRSTTLLSGSSSFSRRPSLQLCIRKSLPGHWSLIEPLTHKSLYHIRATGDPTREIRRGSSDGPILGVVSITSSSKQCHLSFANGAPTILVQTPRKLWGRGRHRFAVGGREFYWKRDIVCREARTRRVFADTDCDTLLVYENAEPFLDVIVATFVAMKFKREKTSTSKASCSIFNVASPPYRLTGEVLRLETINGR
jgi:hypothetical protein